MLSYLLASLACSAAGSPLGESRHVLTVVSVLATCGTAAVAYTMSRGRSTASHPSANLSSPSATLRPETADLSGERQFLGRFALALSGVFLFTIVAAGAVNVFIAPCP